MSGAVLAAIAGVWFLLIVLFQSRRDAGINRHPYRDPHGSAPAASSGRRGYDPEVVASYRRGTR